MAECSQFVINNPRVGAAGQRGFLFQARAAARMLGGIGGKSGGRLGRGGFARVGRLGFARMGGWSRGGRSRARRRAVVANARAKAARACGGAAARVAWVCGSARRWLSWEVRLRA